MLLKLSLNSLTPTASAQALCESEAQALPAYEAYLRSLGQHYVGAYQVQVERKPGTAALALDLRSSWAEVCLAPGVADQVEVAALREVSRPRPPEVQAMLDRRRSYLEPRDRFTLWLKPMFLSPLARQPMKLDGRLLRLALRYLPAGRTIDELSQFGQGVVARYAEFMRQARWNHVGTFHTFGFPEYLYVDTLDVIEAATPAEAMANDAAVPVTPEMQSIYDECALYLDRTRERYVLWLQPIMHGSNAQHPFSLVA
jgi:hypothetical protein